MSDRRTPIPAPDPDDEPQDGKERGLTTTRKEQATGERVDPERRKLANELLARYDAGEITKQAICDTLQMDPRTLAAIQAEDMPEIAAAKTRIIKLAFESVVYNLQSAAQKGKDGKGSAMDAKMSFDVMMGAMGEASTIVQHDHFFPALTEFGQDSRPVIELSPA